MLEIFAFTCLVSALILLYFLCDTDLKYGILPNELVLGLVATGFVFHITTFYQYNTILDMISGFIIGSATLYLIRATANKIYKDDTLGLGDVKLLGAAGVWFGPQNILITMTLGALMGFVHGCLVAAFRKFIKKEQVDLNRLSLPAGPGFAIGMILMGIYLFYEVPILAISYIYK